VQPIVLSSRGSPPCHERIFPTGIFIFGVVVGFRFSGLIVIECYEGRLGGGKTYTAVTRMVDAWVAGATVCTNVAVRWPAVKEYVQRHWKLLLDDRQFIFLEDSQIPKFHLHTPSNCLIVLDEAHLWFNARDWSQSDRDLLAFLTQSRKYQTDVIFISQAAANMDKQFMRLVQFIWRFRDMSQWTIPGLGLRWPLQQIMAIRLDYDGRTVLERRFFWKSKEIFALYDTNAVYKTSFKRLTLDSRGAPVSVRSTLRQRLLRGWVLVRKKVKGWSPMKVTLFSLILVAGLLAGGWFGHRVWKAYHGAGLAALTGTPIRPAVSSTNVAVSAVTSSGSVSFATADLSPVRCCGFVSLPDGTFAIIVGDRLLTVGDTFDRARLLGVQRHSAAFFRAGKVFILHTGDVWPSVGRSSLIAAAGDLALGASR